MTRPKNSAAKSSTNSGCVAVSVGPGSFTGLRVGVVCAKTFAYAVGCAVLGISTLDVIAAQAPPVTGEGLLERIDRGRRRGGAPMGIVTGRAAEGTGADILMMPYASCRRRRRRSPGTACPGSRSC